MQLSKAVLASVVLMTSQSASTLPPAAQNQFTSIWPANCREVSVPSEGEAVAYDCPGPLTVRLVFVDGTRLGISFPGSNRLFGPYSSDREQNWPVQWIGTGHGSQFQPYAAIIRMKRPAEVGEGTGLVVISLREEPCLLGEVAGPAANARAVQLTERACPASPETADLLAGPAF